MLNVKCRLLVVGFCLPMGDSGRVSGGEGWVGARGGWGWGRDLINVTLTQVFASFRRCTLAQYTGCTVARLIDAVCGLTSPSLVDSCRFRWFVSHGFCVASLACIVDASALGFR